MNSRGSDDVGKQDSARRVSGGAAVPGQDTGQLWAFKTAWVYFAGAPDDGPVKIGWTDNLKRRLMALQNGCPFRLEMLGAFRGRLADEERLHAYFAVSRIRPDGEWFNRTGELGLLIGCLQAKTDMRMGQEFDWVLKRERYT